MSLLEIAVRIRNLGRWIVVVALAATVFTPESGAQGDARIVFVDSQRIFMEYEAYQQAQQAYQVEYDGWTEQLREREQELLDLNRSSGHRSRC